MRDDARSASVEGAPEPTPPRPASGRGQATGDPGSRGAAARAARRDRGQRSLVGGERAAARPPRPRPPRPRPPARRALRGPAGLERAPGPPGQRAPPLRRGAFRGHPPALRPAPGTPGPAPRRGRRAARPPARESSSSTCRTSCAASTSSSAEYEPRPRRPGARPRGPARAARAARGGAAAAGMKTVLVCAAQAPFVTGGAEILVRELAFHLARRGFRVDVVALPFHAPPALRAGAPGARLAPPRAAGDERPRGRPRDPHEVPVLSRARPAQGRLALPPAPRGLRPLRHAARLLRRRPRGPAGPRGRSRHGRRGPGRVPARVHDLPQRGGSPGPLQRARGDAASPAAAGPGPLPHRRLRGLSLLRGAARAHQAGGPRAAGARREHERGPAEDRRPGLPRGRAAPPRRDARRRRAGGLPRLRLAPTTSSPSTPAAARRGTRRRTRTTAT